MSSEKVSLATNSATGSVTVTPSASTVYDPPGRGLYVGVTGNVVVRMAGDLSQPTFVAVPAGTILPIAVDMVLDTGTASSMVLLR